MKGKGFSLLPILFLLAVIAAAAYLILPREKAVAGYWLMDSSTNHAITHTSIPLNVGDEYISADNKIYRIIKITRDKAYVKCLE